MEPWKVRMPVVADLHHLDVEQDLDKADPDPHQSEKSDPDRQD